MSLATVPSSSSPLVVVTTQTKACLYSLPFKQAKALVSCSHWSIASPSRKPYLQKPAKHSDCSSLFLKIKTYPKLTAVVVHNRDINVRGYTWVGAKTPAGASELNPIEPYWKCIVLDIEGTTTPISFVTDVLFPYARDNVGRHLSLTYDSSETQDDIELLRAQVQEDLEAGVAGSVPIPSDEAGKENVIAALVANVDAMIKSDRKITALKQLQGHIWRTGFRNKELEAVVFEDVPEALERWHTSGIKVYIYSSGSRLAQRLIFGNTTFGDLRKYFSGFFDTKVGNKKDQHSYVEISESVGVDEPSEILFLTDVYQEATAAKAAGLEVMISVRPGNGPLRENHGFKTVNSFSQV